MSLRTVGDLSFAECGSLEIVHYAGSAEQWGYILFEQPWDVCDTTLEDAPREYNCKY